MSRFEPPEWLLKKINYGFVRIGNRRVFIGQYAIITAPTFAERSFYRYVAALVIGAIKECFGAEIAVDEDHFSFGQNLMNKILLEALINVAEHGNKKDSNKRIEMGYWVGKKGFILGFKDNSNFFRDGKIIEQIMNGEIAEKLEEKIKELIK